VNDADRAMRFFGSLFGWEAERVELGDHVSHYTLNTEVTVRAPDRPPDFAQPFVPQPGGVVEALIRDPDGREVSLQAPLPEGIEAPDADAHHHERYTSR